MKNEKNSPSNLLKALGSHKNLIIDLGDDIYLNLKWNRAEQIYEDEMGKTTMDLLIQIANNEVYIRDKLVKLYIKEEENE